MIRLFRTRKGNYFLIQNKAIVFGNRNLKWECIKRHLPFEVYKLAQSHSSLGVEQPQPPDCEGDAHWVRKRHSVGLCIYTADCAPLLLVHPSENNIAAFHCGWRGIASQLIDKNIANFEPDPVQRKQLLAFLGPHILWDSFEVGEDVGHQILSSLPNERKSRKFVRTKDNGKLLIDLKGIVREQVLSHGISLAKQILDDTYLSPRYHSFRRDGSKSERQWSLVFAADSSKEAERLASSLMA